MGMGDCLRCVKYLLFVFNLIFCLIGLGILGIGVWLFVDPQFRESELSRYAAYAGIFIMIIGGIIALLGFLGCCGAIFENRCLLVLFFILLLLVFLVLLAAGIIFLVSRTVIATGIEAHFVKAIEHQNETINKNYTDAVQSTQHCCGAAKAEKDYTDRKIPIPESCHKDKETHQYQSCTKMITEQFNKNVVRFSIAFFVAATVSLLGMIFSMMLCCAISDTM